MTSFLTFSGQPAPAAQESASLSAQVTTKSGSLNLRQSPNTSAKVLCTIPQYAVIPIYEQGAAWCKTAYNGSSGYVMTSFLTFSGQPAASTPAPVSTPAPAQESASQYARVTTQSGSLNLRQNPSASAKVLRTIPRNETIPILEKGASWCKTAYGCDTCNVMTQFLTYASHSAQLSARVTTQSGSLNLRESSSTSSRVKVSIPQNDMVGVLGQGAEWCRVAYNGVTGYVMTRYLTFFQRRRARDGRGDQPDAAGNTAPGPDHAHRRHPEPAGRLFPVRRAADGNAQIRYADGHRHGRYLVRRRLRGTIRLLHDPIFGVCR
jgi:uncharacterized protein YgiM (DUF1202 family)